VQDAEALAVWLSEHVLAQGHPDEHVNAPPYQRLHDLGIEPRTPDRLDRILASASSAFEERFCTETAAGCALSGALNRSLWLCIKYQGR